VLARSSRERKKPSAAGRRSAKESGVNEKNHDDLGDILRIVFYILRVWGRREDQPRSKHLHDRGLFRSLELSGGSAFGLMREKAEVGLLLAM
jgi:hypothetical protein